MFKELFEAMQRNFHLLLAFCTMTWLGLLLWGGGPSLRKEGRGKLKGRFQLPLTAVVERSIASVKENCNGFRMSSIHQTSQPQDVIGYHQFPGL